MTSKQLLAQRTRDRQLAKFMHEVDGKSQVQIAEVMQVHIITIAKWKKARATHAEFKKTFKEQKVIKQLAEQQATPEEIRS